GRQSGGGEPSKAPMQSRAEYGHRPAVAVVGGMIDKLVVDCAMKSFPDLEIVVRFHQFFQAIAERAIAGENAPSAFSKKFLVSMSDVINGGGDAKCILRPAPGLAFYADAYSGRAIHIRKGPGFIESIAPSQP